MKWQTLIEVARATFPASVAILVEAGKLGAHLKHNGLLGWQISWIIPRGVHHEHVMRFRAEKMKPMVRDITSLMEGLPCYVGESEILRNIPGSLQAEMFEIHNRIVRFLEDDNTMALASLSKRLKAVRRLWNNTRERWKSGCIWMLIFDEISRVDEELCPLVVALSASNCPIKNTDGSIKKRVSTEIIQPDLMNKYSSEINRLVYELNNGVLDEASRRYVNQPENSRVYQAGYAS